MAISFAGIVFLCIASASALGCSIVLSFFLLMWCGCCHVSDSDLDDDHRGGRHGEVVLHNSSDAPPVEPERKGIPLNSKPPRLTPEQELLRDRALEKYKRRKAREERRRARQAARERRVSRCREGDGDDDDDGGEAAAEDNYYDDDGRSSVTSRTTLTSHATTVRTASTAAYGRGNYLLPPPHLCGVDMDLEEDEDENCHDVRSVYSRSSRRSSGSTKSKSSSHGGGNSGGGGTVATIKSYMRHRQRQRLRRREEQQQIDLFNQWATAQMASSSELSPSSKSSVTSSDGEAGPGSARGRGKTGGSSRGGRCGGRRRAHDALESSMNSFKNDGHLNNTMSSAYGGHFDYWQPQSLQQQQPLHQRSSSVASSAPRPPEEVLGEEQHRYPFMTGGGANGEANSLHREQVHLQAGFPATPNVLRVHAEFGPPAGQTAAAVATSHPTTSLHADPNTTQQQQQQQLPPAPPQSPSQQSPQPPPKRRTKRTWKDVEHNVALSGFFNSPANNSFGGTEAQYDDGEAPAPFHAVTSPNVEPSHSPLGYPHQRRE